MIKLYHPYEMDFENNGGYVMQPFICEIEEQANGNYELYLEADLQYVDMLEEWHIITAPTPNGEQPFRIYRALKTLDRIEVYGQHIFYDLQGNFLGDVRPTDLTAGATLDYILQNTRFKHKFTGYSDLQVYNTAYYIRKNPVEAIIGTDNSILNRWGGFLERDNFKINIWAKGKDNGYSIEYGKNLIGIEDDLDISEVVTSLMPTWTSGDGNKVNNIPGTYIDSSLMDHLPVPRVQEYRVELTEKEQELSESEIINIVKDKATKQFTENKIDEPRVSINIDFVELSRTEEYKDLKFLQTINLHDYVTVKVPKLDIDITAQVVYYKYDSLTERYITLTIGNPKRDLSSNSFTFHELNNKIDEATDFLTGAMDYAQNVITGNQGGHVVIRSGEDGKPYEILIMDNEDIKLAKNVIRMNKEGIGFSSNGYNGRFSTAITIGGGIVADFITTGVLSANLIKAGILQDNKGNVVIDFDKGTFRMKSSKNGVNFTLDDNGYNQYNSSGKQTFGVDSYGNVKISGGVKTFFDNGNTAIEMEGSLIEFFLKNTNRSQGYISASSWSGYPNVGAITLTHRSNSSLGIFYESGSSTYAYMIFDRHLQSPQDSGSFGEKPIRILLGTRFESEAVFDNGIRTMEIDCRGSINSSGSIRCPSLITTSGMIDSSGSIYSGGNIVASEDVRTGDGWIEKGVRYSLKQIWDRI